MSDLTLSRSSSTSSWPREDLAPSSVSSDHTVAPGHTANAAHHIGARPPHAPPSWNRNDMGNSAFHNVPLLGAEWVERGADVRRGHHGLVYIKAKLQLPRDLNSSHPFHSAWLNRNPDAPMFASPELSSGLDCVVKEMRHSDYIADRLFGLSHPNIVRAYGWCKCPNKEGYVWLIMERGEQDLSSVDVLSLTPDQRGDLVRDVAAAITYLGGCGVVHGDIHPRNIIRCGATWKLGNVGLVDIDEPWTDPKSLDPTACLEYDGLPRDLQAQIDVYSLGKLVEHLFRDNAVAIREACCAPELYLRCTSQELLRDALVDDLVLNRANVEASKEKAVELRLRLMHYYHQEYQDEISASRRDLPFSALFQQPRLNCRVHNEHSAPFTIDQLFEQAALRNARVVVLRGDFGAGKTILTRHMGREQPLTKTVKRIQAVIVVPLRLLANHPNNDRLSARALAQWSIQRTDDSFLTATLSLLEAVGWESVLWVLDGYDEVQTTMRPFIDRHVRELKKSFMRRVLLTSSYSTDAVGTEATTVHLLPWSRDDTEGFIAALRTLTTVGQEGMTLKTIETIVGRPASDLPPLLVDLIVGRLLNRGVPSPTLAHLVLHVCEDLVQRAQSAAGLLHCVNEVAQHAEDFLQRGEIKVPLGHSLSRNPIVITRGAGDEAMFALHHRMFGEVLLAWRLLHFFSPADLPKELQRVLKFSARLRVDPAVLGTALGGLLSVAFASSEWSVTRVPAPLLKCIIGTVPLCSLPARVRADFVAHFVSALRPTSAARAYCVNAVIEVARHTDRDFCTFLVAACVRTGDTTLLAALHDEVMAAAHDDGHVRLGRENFHVERIHLFAIVAAELAIAATMTAAVAAAVAAATAGAVACLAVAGAGVAATRDFPDHHMDKYTWLSVVSECAKLAACGLFAFGFPALLATGPADWSLLAVGSFVSLCCRVLWTWGESNLSVQRKKHMEHCCRVLGCGPDDARDVVRQQIRKKRAQFHPDRGEENEEAFREVAAAIIAYSRLREWDGLDGSPMNKIKLLACHIDVPPTKQK